MRKSLDYVCMQPTRQGQASYAHVNEIVAGLRRRGWAVRLVEPPHPRPGRADGLRRAFAAARTQLGYMARCRLRPAPFVYIRSHFLTLPAALLAKAAGCVVLQEVNGPAGDAYDAWPLLRWLGPILRLASNVQYRLADVIVVVTPGLEGYLRERTGRTGGYRVIGNGADVDRFQPRPELGIATGAEPYVVFVGALASWQGIDAVLGAVMAPGWPPGVDLVIAGEGREWSRVRAAADACPRVRWLGTVPYADTPDLVAGSMAAVVPMTDAPRSRYGLSPLKLFEAMACGVPVVASDLPGLGDIVRATGCGLTIPAGDPVALAGAVAQLAADPTRGREMGRRGREAVVAHYSWDARAGQTERALLEVAELRSMRPGRPKPGRRAGPSPGRPTRGSPRTGP